MTDQAGPEPPRPKIAVPRLGAATPRPRVFRALDTAARAGAVHVHGPPGVGKTTAVAAWVRARRLRTIWYSVDRADADPATVFQQLDRAARAAGVRGELPPFRPEAAASVGAFALRWFRSLAERLPSPWVIVFDDVQEASGAAAFVEVLRSAVSETPGAGAVVLVARTPPPAGLARAVATGALRVLDPDVLKVTRAEAARMLRRRRPRARPVEVRRAHAASGGWAAGLILLAAGDAAPEAPRGASAAEALLPYFEREVVGAIAPDAARLLAEIAVLPRARASDAAELTGRADAAAVLAELARRGLFVTRLGGEDPVYVLHPLFREHLRASRSLVAPDRLAHLRRGAVALLARGAQLEDAVAVAREGELWSELAERILAAAPELVAACRFATLREWIGALPAELVSSHGLLSYWLGVAVLAQRPADARPALERAYRLLRAERSAEDAWLAWAAVVESFLYELADFSPLDRWLDELRALREELGEPSSPRVAVRVALAHFGALVFRRPGDPELPAWEARMAALAREAPDPAVRRRAGFALARLALWRGDLALASVVDAVRPPAEARTLDPLWWLEWYLVASRIAAARGDGASAARIAQEGIALADQTGLHHFDVGLLMHGSWGALNGGDAETAERMADAAERASPPGVHFARASLAGLRVATLAALGKREPAVREVQRAMELARAGGCPFSESWGEAFLAQVLFWAGDRRPAAEALERALRLAREHRDRFVERCCAAVRASLLADEDPSAASREAARALAIQRETGIRETALVFPRFLATACALALEHGLEVDEARSFVKQRGLAPPPGSPAPEAWPWPVRIRALGPLEVDVEGAPRADPARLRRPLALVRALVAHGSREVRAGAVAEALWPESDASAARHALETTLYRVRKWLGADAVRYVDGMLSLSRDRCWVDAFELEERLAASMTRLDRRERAGLDALRTEADRVVALYRAPLLAGDASEPSEAARARLRRRLVRWLEALASIPGDRAHAAAVRARLADADPALADGVREVARG